MPLCCTCDAPVLAMQEVSQITHRLRNLKLRKAVPSWAMPGEMWRQLAAPNRYFCHRRSGVGHDTILCNAQFKHCLFTLLLSIRSSGGSVKHSSWAKETASIGVQRYGPSTLLSLWAGKISHHVEAHCQTSTMRSRSISL